MEPVQRRIYYYETAKGRCPYAEWRDSLRDTEFIEALQKRLIRIRLGLFGHMNSIGDGVQELKFDIGPGYRVYFAEWGKAIIVLLCGGIKDSQRRKDVGLAKRFFDDFRRTNL